MLVKTKIRINDSLNSYLENPYPIELKTENKHYNWGQVGKEAYLPTLLNCQHENKPWAELWIGIHKNAPTKAIIDAYEIPLEKIYKLSELAKILSAADMLSLQVHPNKLQAETGFKIENKEKVAKEKRTYFDRNAKPEVVVPLTYFWLMVDFLPQDELVNRLKRYNHLKNYFYQEITELSMTKDKSKVLQIKKSLFSKIVNSTQFELNKLLEGLAQEITEKNQRQAFTKHQIEYWFLKALKKYSINNSYDRGLLSFFLLNLVHLTPYDKSLESLTVSDAVNLKPGDAIYIDSGVPHMYLEGVCFEQMKSSDNVVRAGLTDKYINIPELLKIIDYSEKDINVLTPNILKNQDNFIVNYPSPNKALKRFDLSILSLNKIHALPAYSWPQIILVLEGTVNLAYDNEICTYKKGQIVLIPQNMAVELKTDTKALCLCFCL